MTTILAHYISAHLTLITVEKTYRRRTDGTYFFLPHRHVISRKYFVFTEFQFEGNLHLLGQVKRSGFHFGIIILVTMEPKTPSEYINVSLEVENEQSRLISIEGSITAHQLQVHLSVSDSSMQLICRISINDQLKMYSSWLMAFLQMRIWFFGIYLLIQFLLLMFSFLIL